MRKDAAARRQRIVELAAAGLGPRAIAERVGVTDRTIREHFNDPWVGRELRRLQDERLRLLTGRALDGAGVALGVLRGVAEDGAQPAGARVTAAKALLEAALRLVETRDLVERVAALEAQLGDVGPIARGRAAADGPARASRGAAGGDRAPADAALRARQDDGRAGRCSACGRVMRVDRGVDVALVEEASMVGLDTRVTSLEATAEEIRLRPYRRLAAEYGVPIADVLADVAEVREFVDRLVAEGRTLDEVMARCAAHWGLPLDAVRRTCEAATGRYVA